MLANFRDEFRQLETTLSECITEIDRLRELMKEDDIKIARSQARTCTLMAEINDMRADDKQRRKKL